MKTLIQVNITPEIGMIVESLKGRYKHHIIGFDTRFLEYRNGTAIYTKHVHTVNQQGSSAWIDYDLFINNYGYVGTAATTFTSLFEHKKVTKQKEKKIKEIIKTLEELIT